MQTVRSRLSLFVYKFSRGMSPYSVGKTINPDIAKERKSAQFKVEEFAVWWHGGVKKLQEKREMARLILEDPELQDEYPSTYLSYQDMYDNSIRRLYLLAKKLRKLQAERNPGGTDIFPTYMQGRLSRMLHDQGSPIDLHLNVFVPAIKGHGTPEQVAKWLPLAMNFEILGTYVQTELGHGTYLRGLETRADYDPKTEEFVLSSPTLSSHKWWPGGLGHTVNFAVVMAQLYIENKSHGVQMFMVQLRDKETHMPLPGITIGDIGNKMGMQTVNNGFLAFKDYRIPRMNMLMKNSQVLPDGTFKKSPVSVLAYLTMVEVRVSLVRQSADVLSWASTIATRYAAVRRQSVINPSEPEHQIMDHVTQQMKLFPPIAKAIMLKLNSDFVCEMFDVVTGELKQQKYDRLPEMHALSCCLKAISTEEARQSVEILRMSCGGHGYMLASALPMIYGSAAPAPTYEGENTVLLLQTARFLMKSWAIAASGGPLTPTVAYLGDAVKSMNAFKWDASLNGMVKALQFVAANKTRVAFNELESKKKQMTKEEASNVTAIELVQAAEAHGVCFIAATAVEQIIERPTHNSAQLSTVLRDLLELYLVNACLQNMGSMLRFISLTETDLKDLQQRLGTVLARIRPNAVAIVDGFDYHDKELRSALGCYDGNVYEKMYEMAQQNPMNKIPVQKSFQQYLKPFMKANL